MNKNSHVIEYFTASTYCASVENGSPCVDGYNNPNDNDYCTKYSGQDLIKCQNGQFGGRSKL